MADHALSAWLARLRGAWRRRGRVPFVPQMEMAECGAAALAMVMAYHRYSVPLAAVRERCGTSRDGVTAADLMQAAEHFGFEAAAFRVTLDDLDALPRPSILHWRFAHFVVLERLGARRATLIDPGGGRFSATRDELDRHFTGVALAIRPGPAFRPRPAPRRRLAGLGRLLAPHRRTVIQLLAVTALWLPIGLLVPIATQWVLDRLLDMPGGSSPWPVLVAVAVGVVVGTALHGLRTRTLHGLQVNLDWSLMNRYAGHLLRLPIEFFLRRRPGELADRMRAGVQLRDLVSTHAIALPFDLLLLATYTVLMLHYQPPLAAAVAGLAALRIVALVALRPRQQRLLTTELIAAGHEKGMLVETLGSFESMRATGHEARTMLRWTHRATRRVQASLARGHWTDIADQLTATLQALALAAVFWLGGRAVLAGTMSIGALAAFSAVQGLFFTTVARLIESAEHWQRLAADQLRLDDVLDTPSERVGGHDPGRLRGAVTLEHLAFRYAPQAPFALDAISLDVVPGSLVGLVGPAGAGKSTLARLMVGLLTPHAGVVRFDGRDLATLDLTLVRRQLGVVLQEPFVFDDTLRANITLGADADDVAVRRALTLACCDALLHQLPGGLDAHLGARGARVSAGQRQRICLARALLRRPGVLLLDEATSNVDRATEARIHRNLAALRCTRIVVAHRLDVLETADQIAVIDEGRLAELGTWASLNAARGRFWQLCRNGGLIDG